VAMVLGYERAIPLITSQNPQLNFGVVPFPSFKNRPNVNFYGSTILFVVNKNSPHLKESLAFLKYLSSANASEKYFLSTKHPPARRDLIQKYLNDPLLNAFISQILASKSYYQFDSEAIQDAFKEMIFNARKKNFQNYENISRTFNTLNYLWQNPPSD
jgi:maltose-binding protein MalE